MMNRSPLSGSVSGVIRRMSLFSTVAHNGSNRANSVAAKHSVQARSSVKFPSHQSTCSSAVAACPMSPNGPGFAMMSVSVSAAVAESVTAAKRAMDKPAKRIIPVFTFVPPVMRVAWFMTDDFQSAT